ncbi:bifunctional UDP-glucose 4-epimerase/aldose 1-epimerase [Cyberlindnera jadinii NRRL Y-1542]|uniref:UDP-glucose 4-epimerase n=1 Tax=Cyberlindnera jadinii (strain ATCC 18201 / CBS 1600 / BCRC 20928 / JCM 3617 / NBRC 0987 / NRRL Y-1542) TaxID=983966 RepID=A0A1E4S383_CYBJN|nr:UDP-glucose 4-epimerase [Cyberlindnera jadinii NRRL Y-1542]ODV73987.1 UDP-glucose 4-epimerase [Cyberlindnera jadinii NRRL Y-1542]
MTIINYTLVTGGLGYIASHTIPLIEGRVVIVDNCSNSNIDTLKGINALVRDEPVDFYHVDLTDAEQLAKFFDEFHNDGHNKRQITRVLHFAGLKSVSDSLAEPELYYDHNVKATVNLLDQIRRFRQIETLVFASSAAVYGAAQSPISESIKCIPTTPYGATKLKVEAILREFANSYPTVNIGMLRYFNPVGVHPSGLLGEQSKNLMPMVLKSLKEGKEMTVYDGIRDYVSVLDVARACMLVIQYLEYHRQANVFESWNLGSGQGLSVKEILELFKASTGVHVPYREAGKREGDVDVLISDITKAKAQLDWQPCVSLDQSFKDLWRWYTSQ